MRDNKAVFLDRDGTINVDKDYVYKIDDFEFVDGAVEAIKLLNEHNFTVIVVTNQSGVARGYYSEEDVQKLHKYIQDALTEHRAKIDRFYYCPHHPEAKLKRYRIDCECRKPKPGLLQKAVRDFDIEPTRSYLIGDSLRDMRAGKSIGCKTVLISPRKSPDELEISLQEVDLIKSDLISAVKIIVGEKNIDTRLHSQNQSR